MLLTWCVLLLHCNVHSMLRYFSPTVCKVKAKSVTKSQDKKKSWLQTMFLRHNYVGIVPSTLVTSIYFIAKHSRSWLTGD